MTTHRLPIFVVLGCAGALAMLFYGCSNADPPVYPPLPYLATAVVKHDVPNGEECNVDQWCTSGFCNGGICDDAGAKRRPNRAWCHQDADCQSGFCDDRRCAALRADLVPHGHACSADAQCQSGFCDRGTCARRVTWRDYGVECVLAVPGTPAKEMPERAFCSGYLCLDGRCRSCQSDSECTRWQPPAGVAPPSEPLTCTKFLDWPGKQCGKVIPGQVCPNGNPPVPQAWPNEGPEVHGGPPGPPRPEIDCQTWPDM